MNYITYIYSEIRLIAQVTQFDFTLSERFRFEFAVKGAIAK